MKESNRTTPQHLNRRYAICAVIFLCYMFVYFHRLCPAVIALEMQKAFQVSETLLGVLGSAYFYSYALMQIPVGLLADSWGPRKTVFTFFLAAAFGSILMGATESLSLAVIGRVFVGIGVSTIFVCNFKLLAEWFHPREFVIVGGIFMAMGGIGALSAGAPLAWISDLIGWRMTLVAVGIVTLFMAALVLLVVRDRPSISPFRPARQASSEEPEEKIGLFAGMKMVVTSGRFWPISIWAFFATGIAFAIAGLWGGPYLMTVYGMSKAQAGGVLSTFAIGLIISSPLLGWAANRFGRKPVLIGCSVIFTSVLVGFYLFTDTLPVFMLYVLVLLLCFSGAAAGPIIATVSKELFPASIAGTSVGIVNLFPFFGGAIYQVVMGAILSASSKAAGVYTVAGFKMMFLICLIGAVISFISALFIRETLNRAV